MDQQNECTLFEVQSLDLEIDDLMNALRGATKESRAIDERLASAASRMEELTDELKNVVLRVREKEALIDDLRRKKDDAEARVVRLTNEKQLVALRHEMDALEQRISSEEEVLLDIYEEQEKVNTSIENCRREQDEEQENAVTHRARLAQETESNLNLLQQRRQKRSQLISSLDPDLASRYERLHERLGGRVVLETDDQSCPGCGMAVRVRDLDKMKADRSSFVDCPTCGRMLQYVGV